MSFSKFFLRKLIPNQLVNLFWHLPKAVFANVIYAFPSRSLEIIGVTGTDGKTTTATLIYEILTADQRQTALISTVSAKFADKEIPTGLHVTSPDPLLLQRILRETVKKGISTVVLEVTSHGLDQYRFWGIKFKIGVITNVSEEHLDYHHNFRNYLKAKGKLFRRVKFAVLNRDDRSYRYLDSIRSKKSKLVDYSLKKQAACNLTNFKFTTPLLGDYNLSNCLAAISVAKILNVSDEVIRKAIFRFNGVVGRLEEIKMGQAFRVFIDFAHTPNALENLLKALKNLRAYKLIVVFGAAGLRDHYKRPKMGRIAAELADYAVITAEDPRTENADEIIKEIVKGCQIGGMKKIDHRIYSRSNQEAKLCFCIRDRRQAINWTLLKLAQAGDLVVFCGKGHEKSMCYGKEEVPWSEHKEVRTALQRSLKMSLSKVH